MSWDLLRELARPPLTCLDVWVLGVSVVFIALLVVDWYAIGWRRWWRWLINIAFVPGLLCAGWFGGRVAARVCLAYGPGWLLSVSGPLALGVFGLLGFQKGKAHARALARSLRK